jgi:hypothetical protein
VAFNGSGTFTRPVSAYTYDTVISETSVNAEMDGMATGLSNCVTKDGQTTVTANLPMATYRHTGVGNASARTDYAAAGQVQDSSFVWCGTAGGTANALTLTPTPAITAYATGQRFVFQAGASPSTSTVTVAVSGLATKAVQYNDAAMSASVVIDANKYYEALYDGTAFQITRLSGRYADAALTRGYALAGNSSGVAAGVDISTDGKALVGNGTDAVATGILKQGLQTVWVPATAMIARTTNGAAAGSAETTINKVMLKTLDFDASTQEYAQFTVRFPKNWNLGTVTVAAIWSHAATATNFGVVWEVAGLALSDGDAADAAFGTAQTCTDTGGTTDDIYTSPTSAAITISNIPAAGDLVVFQVGRKVGDASDTMAIDARLHGLVLFFTTNAADDT